MSKEKLSNLSDELRELISSTISDQIQPVVERSNELEAAMEEMKLSINKDLKLNYLNSVARLLEKEAHELVDGFKCGYHPQTESQCKSWVKTHASMYASMLETGDIAQAFNVLEEFLKVAERNINDIDKNSRCMDDWQQIRKVLKRHHEFARDVGSLFMSSPVSSNLGEMEFDTELVHDEFILPLSHPLRIQILHALINTTKRFTTLKKELGVKNTGLLVHHLKPLTESDLVEQTYNKQYTLTDKGASIVRFLSQVTQSLLPLKPVKMNIQPLVNDPEEGDDDGRPTVTRVPLKVNND